MNNENKPLLLVLGANPSWQKTLLFEKFIPGKVNRANHESCYASGKGINLCRAAHCSNLADTQLFQFAGGDNGRKLCSKLDEAGFLHQTVWTDAETRSCITCLTPDGTMTELIGVSHPVLPDEASLILEYLKKSLSEFADRKLILVIAGSLPDGSDPDIYVKAVSLAVSNGVPVLVDALAGIEKILSLQGRIILKVNAEEFCKIIGCADIVEAHKKAASRYPGKIFAVTNGGENALLSDGESLYTYILPEISAVSPLGAGDTAAAVMSALYAQGETVWEAFKNALAAASANCLSVTAGEYSIAEYQSILSGIIMQKYSLE